CDSAIGITLCTPFLVSGLVPTNMDSVLIADREALVASDSLVFFEFRDVRTPTFVENQPTRVRQSITRANHALFSGSYGLVWTQQCGDVRHVPAQPTSIVGDAPQADVRQAHVR